MNFERDKATKIFFERRENMPEARIIHILEEWFGQVCEPTQIQRQYAAQMGKNIPFDRIAIHVGKSFYINIRQNVNLTQEESKRLLYDLSEVVNLRLFEQAPLLLATLNGNRCQIGILLYWDNNRCYINNDIHWRDLNEGTTEWLALQLRANHQRIAQLPENYLRVLKTIKLYTKDYIDAEIVYFRKFSDTYHMSTPAVLTEQERFSRLLHGTPENEYPDDDLDKLILAGIRKHYPGAMPSSDLFLFDVDLLKFRRIKDKRKSRFTIHGVSARYDNAGNVLGGGQGGFSFNLEMYYYPNVFKSYMGYPIECPMEIEEQRIPHFQQLILTYEPLSVINI